MDLTYRLVRFQPKHSPGIIYYIGMAWNYDLPAFISTTTCTSYAGAQRELQWQAETGGYKLRWFDGEYDYDYPSGQIVSAPALNESGAHRKA